jgi:hypothetical protein
MDDLTRERFSPSSIETHLIAIRLHALDAAIAMIAEDGSTNEIFALAERAERYIMTGETIDTSSLNPGLDASRDLNYADGQTEQRT